MPDKDGAFIEEPKLGYLLGAEEKAGFYLGFGFSPDRPEVLRDALQQHARQHANAVVRSVGTRYGVKYVLAGPLACPDGRSPQVRSVWQIDRGDRRPRFVTAYPE